MTKRSWLNKEVFGWAMFDFANQAFTLVILTTMFHLYFVNHIVVGDESRGRQLWATSGIIALLMVIVVSPLIGALADFSGAKKRLLFVTYVVSVTLTASLGLVAPGQVAAAMVLFVVGYGFYAVGENFMAAFLPELARHDDMGKVSAFGFTLGYTGGLSCLAGAAVITSIWDGPTGYRLVCLWAGIFFLFAALPTFILLRERKQREIMPPGQTMVTIGFHRLAGTFRSIRQYRQLFRFLGIMTFYLAGMQIVIWFAGSIAKNIFGFGEAQLAIYILILTVTAIIGAFVTGRFQDRIGTRRTIILALILWLAVMSAMLFVNAQMRFMFWVLGSGVGFGMGMLGTSTRAMVGLFSPPHKAAEFFGFYGLGTKVAAILGLTLSILAEKVFGGDYNLVVASSGIFFLVGLVLMFSVNERAGRIAATRAAREYSRQHHDYAGEIVDDENRSTE
ncbi:MAG: MFS transporter [Planctomycetota bacterium]|nr:MFS transporter [Planctomycetota bacterium]MCZ6735371.1 MFS transporter [Planctomycetota bacterium]MCZ6811816.1 MFS transporter [Planctomycetota bacterium]